jgi:hypothetical protein
VHTFAQAKNWVSWGLQSKKHGEYTRRTAVYSSMLTCFLAHCAVEQPCEAMPLRVTKPYPLCKEIRVPMTTTSPSFWSNNDVFGKQPTPMLRQMRTQSQSACCECLAGYKKIQPVFHRRYTVQRCSWSSSVFARAHAACFRRANLVITGD